MDAIRRAEDFFESPGFQGLTTAEHRKTLKDLHYAAHMIRNSMQHARGRSGPGPARPGREHRGRRRLPGLVPPDTYGRPGALRADGPADPAVATAAPSRPRSALAAWVPAVRAFVPPNRRCVRCRAFRWWLSCEY